MNSNQKKISRTENVWRQNGPWSAYPNKWKKKKKLSLQETRHNDCLEYQSKEKTLKAFREGQNTYHIYRRRDENIIELYRNNSGSEIQEIFSQFWEEMVFKLEFIPKSSLEGDNRIKIFNLTKISKLLIPCL